MQINFTMYSCYAHLEQEEARHDPEVDLGGGYGAGQLGHDAQDDGHDGQEDLERQACTGANIIKYNVTQYE